MKITGTKKLLIIFFALLCALAVGLGVMITRSGAPSYAYDGEYAEGSVIAEEEANPEEPDEEISSDEQEEAVKDVSVEEEYDERFDEHVIRQIADLLEGDWRLYNFYFHVYNIDAREVLQIILDEREGKEVDISPVVYLGHGSDELDENDLEVPDNANSYTSEDEEQPNPLPDEKVYECEKFALQVGEFRDKYLSGEIVLDESLAENPWFLPPDEADTYATTYYFYGYAGAWQSYIYINFQNSARFVKGRTIHHPATSYSKGIKNYNGSTVTNNFSYNDGELYWQYYLELAPGETFKFTRPLSSYNSTYWQSMSYGTNAHWAYVLNYGWPTEGNNTYILDGDAPTGTRMLLCWYWDMNSQSSYWNYRYCWYGAANYNRTGVADNNGSFALYGDRCTRRIDYLFLVRRTSPLAPTLVDDTATNPGTVNTTTNTKTANFEGNPVKITISHDFGAGIITYSYDNTVTLVSRSQHGAKNFNTSGASATNGAGIDIVFQSSAAGLHVIKIMLVQPATTSMAWPSTGGTPNGLVAGASGTTISTAMSWSDSTKTEIEFRLQINLQSTQKPSMVSEMGVNGARTKKTVNYTGSYQTVKFQNADKNFVGWSSNGLSEASWDDNGNLVLQQKERGTYTINLYLKNPAGCIWSDDGSTTTIQFTFEIKEMLIEKPTQVGNQYSYSKQTTYDGKTQYLEIAPIDPDQVIIIAPGVRVSYADNKAIFEMTDANTVSIIVMPAEGYLWSDSTNTRINFTFTIDPMAISTPTLKQDETGKDENGYDIKYGANGLSKSVTFNPKSGWKATLVIENIPYGSMSVVTALQWSDLDWELAGDTLTLYATNANTYPVNLSLASSNYKWADGAMAPRFELTIDKFELYAPYIAEAASDAIEGKTKTVYYNPDSTESSLYTNNKDKFFELFVGGFTQGNGAFYAPSQISIRYSQEGLVEEWACTHNGRTFDDGPEAYLTLWGATDPHTANNTVSAAGPAGNYIIYITPTSNYVWKIDPNNSAYDEKGIPEDDQVYGAAGTDENGKPRAKGWKITGTNNMVTFKFVITPIMTDQLPMQIPQASGNAWTEVGDRMGSAVYNGDPQYFRIGSPDNPSLFYDSSQMEKPVVEVKNVLSDVKDGGFSYYIDDKYDPIEFNGKTYNPVILMCSAIEAGTYVVKLQLKNHNYAWRDGSGIDIYYTFTIEQQSINNPEILPNECFGYKKDIWRNTLYTEYDGNESIIAISVPKVVNSAGENIIKYTFAVWDVDEDTGEPRMWPHIGEDDTEADASIGRLLFASVVVGTHSVYLSINDPNFKWASGDMEFPFTIEISYAEVDEVLFNYGEPGNMSLIGSENSWKSAEYNPDPAARHSITITRALVENDEGEMVDPFALTAFEDQFYVEISYYKPEADYEVKEVVQNYDNLILKFSAANTYYISVYLTNNYIWRTSQTNDDPIQMVFEITPKYVDIPTIVVDKYNEVMEEEGLFDKDGNLLDRSYRVDQQNFKKTITYSSNVYHKLTLNLGEYYMAFEVDEAQNTSGLTVDATISKSLDKKIRYTAHEAGTYVLALVLSDTNNFAWNGDDYGNSFDSDETIFFTLEILQLGVKLPDVYFINIFEENKNGLTIDNVHDDYVKVLDGTIGDPVDIDPLLGEYDLINDIYTTKLFYLYLFGDAVVNSEVKIDFVALNASTSGYSGAKVSVRGEIQGHYLYAKNVDEYTVTISFNLNSQFNRPNCYWLGVPTGTEASSRTITLKIDKLGLDLPEIIPEPGKTAPAWNGNKLEYHRDYDPTKTSASDPGPSIQIENCLSSLEAAPYMSYKYDESLTKYTRDAKTDILTFSILRPANVGTQYLLTVSLDDVNEYWNLTGVASADRATDDTSDKLIYIVIDKYGVAMPTLVNQGDDTPSGGATYLPDGLSKSFIYDGFARLNSLQIKDVNTNSMTLKASSNATLSDPFGNQYYLSTNSANAGVYTVVVSLKDTVNLKWDDPSNPTADSSDSITFSLIIEPKPIAKPAIDLPKCDLDPSLTPSVSADGLTLKTVYWKDYLPDIVVHSQSIVIKNFPVGDDDKVMFVVNSSNLKFDRSEENVTDKLLTYIATTVGEYELTFSLSSNFAWDDGSGSGDVIITFVIEKKEYTAPTIDDPTGNFVVGNTKTVVYNFNAQEIVINGYDSKIMSYYGTTTNNGESLVNRENLHGATTYTLEATSAGTYTVTFALRDYKNECWTGVGADRIMFTFVIEKLKIAIPVIEANEFLLVNENVSPANTFTTTYDTLRHAAMVLNVLNTDYMTFAMGGNYNDETKGTFVISDEAISASYTIDGSGNKVCQTVSQIFGTTKTDGNFKNTTVTTSSYVDKDNFILMEATEPGTYSVVFSLTNSKNICWSDSTDSDKSVSFIVNKVRLTSPVYKPGAAKTVAYTGAPIKFYISNANNGQPDAWTTPAFYYETASYSCVSDSSKEIEIVSWYGSELIVQALDIGTYEVTVRITDPKHVTWTDLNATYKTFTFNITKSDIIPEIKYVDAVDIGTGATNTATKASLASGATNWAKSITVTARITLTNIRLAVGTASPELDVSGLALEIYYVNTSKPSVKLSPSGVVAPPKDLVTTKVAGLTPGNTATSDTNPAWSVELTSAGIYLLHYDYKILPDPKNCYDPDPSVFGDETLLMGTYRIHVEQTGTSNNYSISSAQKNFTVEADPAPFTTHNADQFIVWEVYLASDPDNVFKTINLSNITGLTSWKNMQPSQAIELPYLDSDSYMIKVNFDANGMQGPDATATPATVFNEALLTWQVKWNGVYSGTPNAKYASKLTATSAPYPVSITIQALDSQAFNFPTTTYKFYYHITPILYDLKGVVWDYSGPFVYDGTAKTVKLINLPTGLSVASYDVTGYDRNVQIYAKSQAEHGAKYVTSVTFTSSNKNYLIPVQSNPASYKDTSTGTGFQWTVEWEINKKKLEVEWDDSKSEDGTSSYYVPILKTDGEKVDYTYYIDNGDPDHNNWTEVTSFEHTGYVDFKVVATLKSSSDPALNFENNYYLEFPYEASPTDNFKIFTLGPSTYINVVLSIGNINLDGTPNVSSFSQLQAGVTPSTGVNMFEYNGFPFEVYLSDPTDPSAATVTLTGAPATINIWDNLIITYYSTVNVYRAINAPAEPGHYLIKLQLKNLPDDGNSYKLAKTEFYFDIDKGTIDPDTYYWRYTHTDTSGKEYVAIYDFTVKKWIIHHTSDSIFNTATGQYEDPTGLAAPEIGQEITEFVYDTKAHTVELYSEQGSILMASTKNKSAVDAGTYTSTVAFSYNGKLWYEPVIQTTFTWVIEKATISLANVNWDDASEYVFTVSGGKVKTYTMTASGLDPILLSYIKYTTKDASGKVVSNILSNAGTYTTELTIEGFDENNPNYKLGNDWPSSIPNPITWAIARREIAVPEANGTWIEFDGKQHDLLTTVSLGNDWAEYFTLSIQYRAFTAGASFQGYDGTKVFGNMYFASHAGDYQFSFAILSSLNADATNVVWEVNNGYGYDYVTTNQNGILMTVDRAVMTVVGWNSADEASTVTLAGNYASNEFVDYRFYYNLASAPAISLGNAVSLIDVLSITADTEFVSEVYVRTEYINDIDLSGGVTGLQFAFNKIAPSADIDDQTFVPKYPYIDGYIADGITITFKEEDWKQMYIDDNEKFSDITSEKANAAGFDWTKYIGISETQYNDQDPEFDWAKYIGISAKDLNDPNFNWTPYLGFSSEVLTDPNFDWTQYFAGYTADQITDEMKQQKFDELKAQKYQELKDQKYKEINYTAVLNKAQVRVNVTYTGAPITFTIHDWTEGVNYVDHLRIWQGNLTQNAAGDYSVTLLFVSDMVNPRSWEYDGDPASFTPDRSPLTLNFRISYFMIDPHQDIILDNLPTYTGGEIDVIYDVLHDAMGAEAFDEWLELYGKYFEIIPEGSRGTNVGAYTLKLKIKDEYIDTVHWKNGTAIGQPGTFSIVWEILPVYIADPDSMLAGGTITYDGSEHSIFELMRGYNNGDDGSMSQYIKDLIQNTIITGDRGVNAKSYTASFSLPNSNYAWLNTFDDTPSSNQDATRSLDWIINPMKLDMSAIGWKISTLDGDADDVDYDASNPPRYTLENGVPQDFELILGGIPEALKDFISYVTDGDLGSTRSAIGKYFTVVYLFRSDLTQSSNYELVETSQVTTFRSEYPDPEGYGYVAIEWKIVQRQYTPPVDTKEVNFSGTVRDIIEDLELIGFEYGWENYFDVSIEYKTYGAGDDEYVSYYDIASLDELLNYNMYNVLYTGTYKVKFAIKSDVNKNEKCVVWFEAGNYDTYDRTVVLTIKPMELRITDWQDDVDEDGYIIGANIVSAEYSKLSDESKKLFQYIIWEKAIGPDKVITDIEYLKNNGIYFAVDFSIIDATSFAAKFGFEIIWDVDHPYEFINQKYAQSTITWLPNLVITYPSNDVYEGKGKDKVYKITNIDAYKVVAGTNYGIDLTGHDFLIEPVNYDAKAVKVDLANGQILVSKAGVYSVTFKLLPNVNLSWYDQTVVTTPNNSTPTDRYAKSKVFEVKKIGVQYMSKELLESIEAMIPDIEFDGKSHNVLEEVPALKQLLESRYGSLIQIDGNIGQAAKDYTMIISLFDKESSYWDLKVSETITVNDPAYAEYDSSYAIKYVQEGSKWVIKYVKSDGYGGYIDYNGGNYKLEVVYKVHKTIDTYVDYDSLFDEDGNLLEGIKKEQYELTASGEFVKYSKVEEDKDGKKVTKYVVDENGTYVAKYKLKPDGSVVEVPEMDANGRSVIDVAKSLVKITRNKMSYDDYEIRWRISNSKLTVPELQEGARLVYNGQEQSIESILNAAFNPSYMEVFEGGVHTDAGKYTAKIRISNPNYEWRDFDGEIVEIEWEIEQAEVDMEGVSWRFTDGTTDYENGKGMIYTLEKGVARIYWVELINLPQALRGNILYNTNGLSGAYAGRDAGKYYTTFSILGFDKNFKSVNIPDELLSIEWQIERRVLELPSFGSIKYVFDDDVHDLFEDLILPENWEEYLTIRVMYASGFGAFVDYPGHNGNPYEAYGAGAYMFVVAIKDGINVNAKNPSVVWKSSSSSTTPGGSGEGEGPSETDKPEVNPPEGPAEGEDPSETDKPEVNPPEGGETEEQAIAVTVIDCEESSVSSSTAVSYAHTESHAVRVTVAQQICDRVKKLTYCTQTQLSSFRKYTF